MIYFLAISFFVILIFISWVNYKVNKEFKIETSWIAISLSPVIIWLLTTQEISELSGYGFAFKFKEASATPISLQLDGSAIKPSQIVKDKKGGYRDVDLFKKKRVQALTLVLGKKNYYSNDAIKYYLKELTPYPFFKYVLFVSQNDEYRGMMRGDVLLGEIQSGGIDLVKLIESSEISKIHGVITNSILRGSTKQYTLQIMEENNLSEIPVINDASVFIGVAERDKITSSIVAQLVSVPGISHTRDNQ